MNFPDLSAAGGAILGGAVGVLVMVLRSLRGVSRHGVGMARDRVERAEIDGMTAELGRLREQVTNDARTIGQLTAENRYLKHELKDVAHMAEKYVRGLPASVQAVLKTDFAPFEDTPSGDRR